MRRPRDRRASGLSHPADRPGAASIGDRTGRGGTLPRSIGRWSTVYETTRTAEEHAFGLDHGLQWVEVDGGGRPCGFALGSLVDGHLHLLELGVARAHQHRGLGTALLATVITCGRERADPVVTLTTERDVPWNGPFYHRHGFVAIKPEALPSGLERILEGDIAAGLDPATRIAMARAL
jgi:GNAT superfamily N-acetyltransferase